MAIIAKKTGGSFVPAPAGVHQAVCCDVVDLGMIESTWGGEPKTQHKIRIIWEINELMEDRRRFTVSQRYTLSLHEKAALRRDLESWRGRQFTDEELTGFDVEGVIRANCMLNVVQVGKDGTTYANVSAIMPLYKGMQKLQISADYVRVKDRKPEEVKNPASGNGGGSGFDAEYVGTDDDVPF